MSGGSAVMSFGPWGGTGGDPWNYIATSGITEITIYSGEIINSISFKDANGFISGQFGGENHNDSGKKHPIPINWPSEYLRSINGSYREFAGNVVISSLIFITNLHRYGPFGNTNFRQTFSIPITDSVVVGFYGRAGSYVDALGIHVQPINSSGSVSIGPWGGTGGESFGFKVDPSYIKQITVSYGPSILQSISFKDEEGHEYGPYGGHDDNGEKAVIEIDGNSERLTSISGTYGTYNERMVITSLSFVINSDIKGPYGSQTGIGFSIPIQGSEVVGFFGSSGWYLDSVGLYVKPRASSNATVA